MSVHLIDFGTMYSLGKERGALFVELALALPMFLLFIFIIIWISVFLNARSSLTSAIGESVRLAATRGDERLLGGTRVVPVIQDWLDGGSAGRLEQLLTSGFSWDDALAYYDTVTVGTVFEHRGLRDMPPEYIYTLVYFNEAMRQSVGGEIRYPCEPDPDKDGEAGCVGCVFLNPDSVQPEPQITSAQDVPRRRVAISCAYRPSNIILDPIVSLMRVFTDSDALQLVVRRSQLMEMPNLIMSYD